jgi:hypothetical protein
MTTHIAPQGKTWAPAVESDCGNLHGVIGYLPAAHGLTLAQNDTVQMVHIPNGATVMGCILETDALGASVTCAVGDDGDTDRYITATDHSSAAITRRKSTAAVGVPYTYSAENTIDVLLEGGNPADNKAIRLDVFYITAVDTTP